MQGHKGMGPQHRVKYTVMGKLNRIVSNWHVCKARFCMAISEFPKWLAGTKKLSYLRKRHGASWALWWHRPQERACGLCAGVCVHAGVPWGLSVAWVGKGGKGSRSKSPGCQRGGLGPAAAATCEFCDPANCKQAPEGGWHTTARPARDPAIPCRAPEIPWLRAYAPGHRRPMYMALLKNFPTCPRSPGINL